MYLDYFGLKMFPFANTGDPRFFYASEAHEEALANMAYAIEQGKGMVVVTGEIGTGKTLVSNVLSLRLRRSTVMVNVTDPLVRGDQLMRCVYGALLTPYRRPDRIAMQTSLQDRLIALQRMGQRVAVLVDEAQDLSRSALEQLRLMSNWEHRSEKLIQWVLIGQNELRDTLARPHWEHLRQRVVLSFHLTRLQGDQVGAYIDHRLTVAAGGRRPRVRFDEGAVAIIAEAARCTPRLINNICDAALLAAFADETCVVTAETARSVTREMTSCGWTDASIPTPAGAPLSSRATG
ncbi:MAG: ExeA family protein [Planctomycetota bacterium]